MVSFVQFIKGYLNNRYLSEWRLLLFTIIVTVYLPICNVIRISCTPLFMNLYEGKEYKVYLGNEEVDNPEIVD